MIHVGPLAVAGLVDYEAIPGMSNSNKPISSSRATSHTPQSAVTVTDVTKQLSSIAECFTTNHLDPVLSRQVFRQVMEHCFLCLTWP